MGIILYVIFFLLQGTKTYNWPCKTLKLICTFYKYIFFMVFENSIFPSQTCKWSCMTKYFCYFLFSNLLYFTVKGTIFGPILLRRFFHWRNLENSKSYPRMTLQIPRRTGGFQILNFIEFRKF